MLIISGALLFCKKIILLILSVNLEPHRYALSKFCDKIVRNSLSDLFTALPILRYGLSLQNKVIKNVYWISCRNTTKQSN